MLHVWFNIKNNNSRPHNHRCSRQRLCLVSPIRDVLGCLTFEHLIMGLSFHFKLLSKTHHQKTRKLVCEKKKKFCCRSSISSGLSFAELIRFSQRNSKHILDFRPSESWDVIWSIIYAAIFDVWNSILNVLYVVAPELDLIFKKVNNPV